MIRLPPLRHPLPPGQTLLADGTLVDTPRPRVFEVPDDVVWVDRDGNRVEAKKFDPNQPRDPHTGEWIDTIPVEPDVLPPSAATVTEGDVRDFIAEHPFGYHQTSAGAVPSIEEGGIRPDTENFNEGKEGSAPGHVYVYTGPSAEEDNTPFAQFRVDLRKLDPDKLRMDADYGDYLLSDQQLMELPPGAVYEIHETVNRMPEARKPHAILHSLKMGSIAYEGAIPPDAIERNPAFWDDPKRVAAHEAALADARQREAEMAKMEADYYAEQEAIHQRVIGRSGNHVWDADGRVYVHDPEPTSHSAHGVYVEVGSPPTEVEDAMNATGIESASLRRMRARWEALMAEAGKDFDPHQPRDRHGRWTDTGLGAEQMEVVKTASELIPDPSQHDKDVVNSMAQDRASKLEVTLKYELDLEPAHENRFEIRDPLDPDNPLRRGHLGFSRILHDRNKHDANGTYNDGDGTITVGQSVMPLVALAEKRNQGDIPLTDAQAEWYFSGMETLQHEIGHSLNPTTTSEYNSMVGMILEEGLNEDTAMALTIEWLKERATPADRDALGWLAANLRDHVTDPNSLPQMTAFGTYQGYRQRLGELFDRAGIQDSVERRDVALKMKYSMNTDQRIDYLAQRLTKVGAMPDFEAEWRGWDKQLKALKPSETVRLTRHSFEGEEEHWMAEGFANGNVSIWRLNDSGAPILGTEATVEPEMWFSVVTTMADSTPEFYGHRARNYLVGDAIEKGYNDSFLARLMPPKKLHTRGFRPIIDLQAELGDVKPRKVRKVKLADGTMAEPGSPVLIDFHTDVQQGTIKQLLPDGKVEVRIPGITASTEVDPSDLADYAKAGQLEPPMKRGTRVSDTDGKYQGRIVGITHVPGGGDMVLLQKRKGGPRKLRVATDLSRVAPPTRRTVDGEPIKVGGEVELMTGFEEGDYTVWEVTGVEEQSDGSIKVHLANHTGATTDALPSQLRRPRPLISRNGLPIHLGSFISPDGEEGTWVVISVDNGVIRAKGPNGEIKTFHAPQIEVLSGP